MIARIWKGWTRGDDAAAYRRYVLRTGVAEHLATPGNCGSWVMCRPVGDYAEFVVMSLWESLDAVRAFAGDDAEEARYFPEDDAFLLDKPRRVTLYEVAPVQNGSERT